LVAVYRHDAGNSGAIQRSSPGLPRWYWDRVILWKFILVEHGAFLSESNSQAKLTMRSEPNKSHRVSGRLLVDQYQVRLDVTIPVVFPFACQNVVVVMLFKRLIVRQSLQNRQQTASSVARYRPLASRL